MFSLHNKIEKISNKGNRNQFCKERMLNNTNIKNKIIKNKKLFKRKTKNKMIYLPKKKIENWISRSVILLIKKDKGKNKKIGIFLL